MDDDDGRGLRTDARCEIRGIDRHRLRIAVDEAQARAGVRRGGGGREERVGRHDDLAVGHTDRAQDDLQRGGAGADRDRVLRAVTRGERLLELSPDGTERELPGRERFVDAGEDLATIFGGNRIRAGGTRMAGESSGAMSPKSA